MKIREIEARSPRYVPLLYQAAWKVFGIPPWDIITAALGGDFAPLKSYLEEVEENKRGTPFRPPRVWRQVMTGALLIWTDGGRSIFVSEQEALVDFVRDGEGSVVAAGEVIGHLREALGTAQPTQDYISVLDDQYHGFSIGDYAGPVHPRLGRITYDSDFAITHPALLVACAKASGEGAAASLCPWGLSDEQFQKWISDSTYSVPVLASCTFGDTQELIKGSALEIAEQLAGKGLIAPETIPDLVEAIAADIDKPETNPLCFPNLEVTVIDTHIG